MGRRRGVPNRPGRGSDGRERRALVRRAHFHRPALFSEVNATTKTRNRRKRREPETRQTTTKDTKTRRTPTPKDTKKIGGSNTQSSKSVVGRCRKADARHDWLLHRSASRTGARTARKNLFTRGLRRTHRCGNQVRAREAIPGSIPRRLAVRATSGFRSRRPDCAGDQVDRPARACSSRADPELHAGGTPASWPADELQCRRSAGWHEQKGFVIRCS